MQSRFFLFKIGTCSAGVNGGLIIKHSSFSIQNGNDWPTYCNCNSFDAPQFHDILDHRRQLNLLSFTCQMHSAQPTWQDSE